MRRVSGILLILFLASGSWASAGAPRIINISGGDDMKFSVTTLTAKPGESIRVRLTSKGVLPKIAMAHNFVLLKIGTDVVKFVEAGAPFRQTDFVAPALKDKVIAKTTFAGPGETVEVLFTAPATPGKYPFICTFSGHVMEGMRGTLIVK
jgi:azurin